MGRNPSKHHIFIGWQRNSLTSFTGQYRLRSVTLSDDWLSHRSQPGARKWYCSIPEDLCVAEIMKAADGYFGKWDEPGTTEC